MSCIDVVAQDKSMGVVLYLGHAVVAYNYDIHGIIQILLFQSIYEIANFSVHLKKHVEILLWIWTVGMAGGVGLVEIKSGKVQVKLDQPVDELVDPLRVVEEFTERQVHIGVSREHFASRPERTARFQALVLSS